jgi:hypothetical protein
LTESILPHEELDPGAQFSPDLHCQSYGLRVPACIKPTLSGKPSAGTRPKREIPMRSILATFALAAVLITPALADDVKKGNDADPDFMTGVRKLGVMTGEAFTCAPEADRQGIGEDALSLANQIALHFGLQIAFIYSGAFGWGSGHDFDHKTCPETLANFKDTQHKYLNK